VLLKETPDCSKQETDWQLRPPKEEMQGWSVTGQDTENNRMFSHSSLCFNSIPSKPRCVNFMQTWLHWIHQYALPAQRGFLASSFTQSLLNVCVVVVTSILQKYTLLLAT